MLRLLLLRSVPCLALTFVVSMPARAQEPVPSGGQEVALDQAQVDPAESALRPERAAESEVTRSSAPEPEVSEGRRARRLRLHAEHYDVTPRQLLRGRAIAATSVALLYTGLWTYNYFAWWHGTPTTPFTTEWDGFLGVDTYGGGADKLGHMYMNLMLSRATTGILRFGRFDSVPASIAGATLSWLSYLLVELRDGSHEFEFSWGDILANSLGTALGLVFTHVPVVDRFFSIRMMYWPSREFREKPSLNFNEDYSGQTFLLAMHMAGFGDRVGFFRYIDFVVGFNARNYLPTPTTDGHPERQHLYFGFALNLQEVLNRGLFDRPRERDNRAQEAARGLFADWAAEHIQVPYTAVPLIQMQRTNHDD